MNTYITFTLLLLSNIVLAAGRPAPAVTTITVEEQPLEKVYYAQGVLEPIKSVEIRSEASGKIVKSPFEEGQDVKAQEIILELDKREALTNLAKLITELELLKIKLSRQEKLVASSAASVETRDQLKSEVSVLNSSIQLAEIELEKLDVMAPFTGTIDQYEWVSGQWISSNTVVATLSDMSTLRVNFSIPERYFSLIELNKSVVLKAIARPNESFIAEISSIGSRLNNHRGTVTVEARINNTSGHLLPGMSVSIEMPLSRQQNAILIPSRSLTYQGDEAMVMLIDEKGVARPRVVTIGIEREAFVEIVDGLSPGDKIIDRGRLKAKPNRPIKELSKVSKSS